MFKSRSSLTMEEDIENLEDVEEEISETIGHLFKTHKDLCDDIIKYMVNKLCLGCNEDDITTDILIDDTDIFTTCTCR